MHELIEGLREQGVTVFLTTHRLEEAERLCDRVAILNTTLRTIGRPQDLRAQLFTATLLVTTRQPLAEPEQLSQPSPVSQGWQSDDARTYTLAVTNPEAVAPELTRALVAAGADVLSIGEGHHSLEDVYLEIVDEDVEAGEAMSRTRIAAVIAKELREFRRNRFLVGTHDRLPGALHRPADRDLLRPAALRREPGLSNHIGLSLLYMLLIPVVVPATIAGYAIVGEREAGNPGAVPHHARFVREEILLGKATAIAMPALAIAYGVYGLFLLAVELFAHPFVASAVFHSNQVLAQPVFIPLLTGWSIWVGIAISTRASDVRVAQQLAILGRLPTVAVTSLMGFGVINPTLTLAVILAVILLAVDLAGWRLVATLFNRERLITGATPKRPTTRTITIPTDHRQKGRIEKRNSSRLN